MELSAKARKFLARFLMVALISAFISGTTLAFTSAVFTNSTANDGNTFAAATLQPPANVAAADTNRSATVSWVPSASQFAMGYSIYKAPAGGSFTLLGSVMGRNTTAYLDDSADGTARYKVVAFDENWYSLDSNEATVTVNRPVVTSAYYNCSTNVADTGGDNNGFQTTPNNGCGTNTSLFAVDANSGTATNTSCANTANDRHRFSGWSSPLPSNAIITGIEVRHVGKTNVAQATSGVCIQLSGDGGATWTATKPFTYAANINLQTATYGGSADLWGATWTPEELTAGNFVIRVINVSSTANRTFSMASLQTRVSYR